MIEDAGKWRWARPFSAAILFFWLLSAVAASEAADWKTYKEAFVSSDGRVIDFFQNSASHSEGQGYGMLLAEMHADRNTFDRIHRWTRDNLGVRRDALHAWSWGRRPNGLWSVMDYNNASDGDALIAWALTNAADRWGERAYREEAARIVRDMRVHLALTVGDFRLIAPAYYGFESNPGAVFNTGYFVLPAYRQFARVDDPVFWDNVRKDSGRVLAMAAFSRFRLPADWVLLENGRASVYSVKSPFFGYEAIRVPLYEAWDGQAEGLNAFGEYLSFVERAGYLPSRVNLVDGSVAMDEAPAGFYAVVSACAGALGRKDLSRALAEKAASKIDREPKDYFSNSLYLLARGRLNQP